MKLHRVAIVAGATLIAAACSGEEPAAAPETTAVVAETIAPTTAPAPTTTAPAPTTNVEVDQTPESLAFGSTRDVGRLFEIDGATQVFDGPAGEATSTLQDGLLVLAAAARNVDDTLYVGIVDPNDQTVALGWVDSQRLRPTTQFFVSTDESLRNQLGQVLSSGQETVNVVTEPGSPTVVGTLVGRESAFITGTRALASNGTTWLELTDPTTGGSTGWIPASNWVDIRGVSARDSEFFDTSRSASSTVTYTAPLPTLGISATGCNAVQIEIQNPSSTAGMALVFGQSVPSAVVGANPEVWRAGNGGQLFVEPGDSTTLTLLSAQTATWYFASLDDDRRATADRDAGGELAGAVGEPAQALDVQQVTVPAGSCALVAPPPDINDEYVDVPNVLGAVGQDLETEESLDGEGTEAGDIEGVEPEGAEAETPATTVAEAPATTVAAATTTTVAAAPTTTVAVEATVPPETVDPAAG